MLITGNLLKSINFSSKYFYFARSPLNVVYAGLDLLIMEMKEMDQNGFYLSVRKSTAELVDSIFSSCGEAINILNDLLNYEHIEAG